ncbi:hypothetical protein Mgra_00001810 [Meloidogyne graminicola]|uniref:Uncharacterized protein n=1 Tax=Meloidogyne graminicola TaxID=189291 RepID=A0A8S9ZZM2_9BILA|nr:hypothetical protein Mgra_00001810 [Meloidogyne graminicola]
MNSNKNNNNVYSSSFSSPSLNINLNNFSVSSLTEEKNKNLLKNTKNNNKFWKMIKKSKKKEFNKSPVYTISPANRSISTFDLQLKKPEPTIFVYSQRKIKKRYIWIRRGILTGSLILLLFGLFFIIIWEIQQQQQQQNNNNIINSTEINK